MDVISTMKMFDIWSKIYWYEQETISHLLPLWRWPFLSVQQVKYCHSAEYSIHLSTTQYDRCSYRSQIAAKMANISGEQTFFTYVIFSIHDCEPTHALQCHSSIWELWALAIWVILHYWKQSSWKVKMMHGNCI